VYVRDRAAATSEPVRSSLNVAQVPAEGGHTRSGGTWTAGGAAADYWPAKPQMPVPVDRLALPRGEPVNVVNPCQGGPGKSRALGLRCRFGQLRAVGARVVNRVVRDRTSPVGSRSGPRHVAARPPGPPLSGCSGNQARSGWG